MLSNYLRKLISRPCQQHMSTDQPLQGQKPSLLLGQDGRSRRFPEAGRAELADSGRCGEAVWLKLRYIDGLPLLNLPWPSAGSNVGQLGGPG